MRHFDGSHIPSLRVPLNLPAFPGPTDLEIGAGQGLHAIRYCRENPSRRLIAIERTQGKFGGLRQRADAHTELTNLIAVHADAISVLTHVIPDRSIEKIFLLYPNPYPKAKQRNLRWHQSPSMELLKAKLVEHGELILATNLLWFADEAEMFLTSTWGFGLSERKAVTEPLSARTHFERKYLLRGETCHNMVFQLQ